MIRFIFHDGRKCLNEIEGKPNKIVVGMQETYVWQRTWSWYHQRWVQIFNPTTMESKQKMSRICRKLEVVLIGWNFYAIIWINHPCLSNVYIAADVLIKSYRNRKCRAYVGNLSLKTCLDVRLVERIKRRTWKCKYVGRLSTICLSVVKFIGNLN